MLVVGRVGKVHTALLRFRPGMGKAHGRHRLSRAARPLLDRDPWGMSLATSSLGSVVCVGKVHTHVLGGRSRGQSGPDPRSEVPTARQAGRPSRARPAARRLRRAKSTSRRGTKTRAGEFSWAASSFLGGVVDSWKSPRAGRK